MNTKKKNKEEADLDGCLSGEMIYRWRTNNGTKTSGLFSTLNNNLKNFLLHSDDCDFINEIPEEEINNLQTLRTSVGNTHVSKGSLEILKTIMNDIIQDKLNEARVNEEMLTRDILNERDTKQFHLVHHTLVLKSTLNQIQKQRLQRRDMYQIFAGKKRKQIKISERLSLFSTCARFETNGKILFHPIPANSITFERCKKAVLLSLTPSSYGKTIDISNIYKVENSMLQENYDASLSKYDMKDVKGLFCDVRLNDLERFVAYGIGKNSDFDTSHRLWFNPFILGIEQMKHPNSWMNFAQKAADNCIQPDSISFRFFKEKSFKKDDDHDENTKTKFDSANNDFYFLAICKVLLPKKLITTMERGKYLKLYLERI